MDTPAHNQSQRVVCAMSGGVDSSVAALLLHQRGIPTVGVSMQVWDYRNHGGCSSRATCCAPDDFTDARHVAATIGIPYYVIDVEKAFRREVIDRFVETYLAGRTPNPCVDCNNKVKFKELRTRALGFGCSKIATGHYARIEERQDGYHLLRGVDKEKDQSYFLYAMNQEELSKTLFPVGDLRKSEVREIAKQHRLKTAHKPESQDICFVSGTVSDFLVRIGAAPKRGNFVSTTGQVLGQHDGIQNFTVGQRRGLRLGGSEEPQYVVEIDAETNTVIVGSRQDLERDFFYVGEIAWCNSKICSDEIPLSPGAPLECLVQVRHRHAPVPVTVSSELGSEPGTKRLKVEFLKQSSTISPGQAAVFYSLDNEEVLGGGRIAGDYVRSSYQASEQVLASHPGA